MDRGLQSILNKLPEYLKNRINGLDTDTLEKLEEIRIKVYTDTIVIADGKEFDLNDGHRITPESLEHILDVLVDYSYYAYEDELNNGFITIEGGHRVGLCGRVTLKNNKVHLIKDISSLNIRRSREVIGASDNIMDLIDDKTGTVSNTLIISPPKCGKTTILRDIARNLSNGGYRVSICDERSELAGCYNGIPSYDLGSRTDILDGCPKAQGIIMLIRSMSPEVIITDEIGKPEDVTAIEEAANSGINIITSIHGSSYDDVIDSAIGKLLNNKIFDTLIFLSSTPNVGSISKVMKVSHEKKEIK